MIANCMAECSPLGKNLGALQVSLAAARAGQPARHIAAGSIMLDPVPRFAFPHSGADASAGQPDSHTVATSSIEQHAWCGAQFVCVPRDVRMRTMCYPEHVFKEPLLNSLVRKVDILLGSLVHL